MISTGGLASSLGKNNTTVLPQKQKMGWVETKKTTERQEQTAKAETKQNKTINYFKPEFFSLIRSRAI